MSADAKVKEIAAADRRLTFLRLLDESGGLGNTATIEKGLRLYGCLGVSRETVNGDARWLGAAGLVTTDALSADLIRCDITEAGERVARGKERVAGVSRPSAG